MWTPFRRFMICMSTLLRRLFGFGCLRARRRAWTRTSSGAAGSSCSPDDLDFDLDFLWALELEFVNCFCPLFGPDELDVETGIFSPGFDKKSMESEECSLSLSFSSACAALAWAAALALALASAAPRTFPIFFFISSAIVRFRRHFANCANP